ncbi:MAG: YbaN family protein, partial [Devosia sp.]
MGWAMLGLATTGVVLPLLPTTPFVLAAAWCFCRSSPRMAGWLEEHPVLGRSIINWQREGAVSWRSKMAAVASMGFGYAITLGLTRLDQIPAALLAALLLAVATFILTRPSPTDGNVEQLFVVINEEL